MARRLRRSGLLIGVGGAAALIGIEVVATPGDGAARAAGHASAFGAILIAGLMIMLLAMLGRGIAHRIGQPAVLGELLIGVLVGNLGYHLGVPLFTVIMHMHEAGALLDALWTSEAGLSATAVQLFGPAALDSS